MSIEVHDYDPAWPADAATVIAELQAAHPGIFAVIEHFGSTSVPGLPAKPVIDIMAAVDTLDSVPPIGLGYTLLDSGMRGRLFYRREAAQANPQPAGEADSEADASPEAETSLKAETSPEAEANLNAGAGRETGTGPGAATSPEAQTGRPRVQPAVHLHIVTTAAWPTQNERILRDHLRTHPEARAEYGRLKQALAATKPDGDTYTRAKTDLIQRLVDAARTERGLPLECVWEE